MRSEIREVKEMSVSIQEKKPSQNCGNSVKAATKVGIEKEIEIQECRGDDTNVREIKRNFS